MTGVDPHEHDKKNGCESQIRVIRVDHRDSHPKGGASPWKSEVSQLVVTVILSLSDLIVPPSPFSLTS